VSLEPQPLPYRARRPGDPAIWEHCLDLPAIHSGTALQTQIPVAALSSFLGPHPHPQCGQLVQCQLARRSCHWSLLVAWWVLLGCWVWGTGWNPCQPPPRAGYHLCHRAHWWSQTRPALEFSSCSCHFAAIRVVLSLYELGRLLLASSGCLACRAAGGRTLCSWAAVVPDGWGGVSSMRCSCLPAACLLGSPKFIFKCKVI
jgi:hypothetical protein